MGEHNVEQELDERKLHEFTQALLLICARWHSWNPKQLAAIWCALSNNKEAAEPSTFEKQKINVMIGQSQTEARPIIESPPKVTQRLY